MTHEQDNYFEQVRVSGRVFAFLGLLLGVTGGVAIGVVIKGLIGEPLVSGGSAIVFYVAFGASSLITFFVMLNYLMMNLQVSSAGLDIKFGMKSATVERGQIVAVRVADTKSRAFRALGPDGRKISRMWTVLGVGSGVEIDIVNPQGSDPKTWFISSREASKLSEKLGALITDTPSPEGRDSGGGHQCRERHGTRVRVLRIPPPTG